MKPNRIHFIFKSEKKASIMFCIKVLGWWKPRLWLEINGKPRPNLDFLYKILFWIQLVDIHIHLIFSCKKQAVENTMAHLGRVVLKRIQNNFFFFLILLECLTELSIVLSNLWLMSKHPNIIPYILIKNIITFEMVTCHHYNDF